MSPGHRKAARRGRAGVLAVSCSLTLVVAGAAFGLLPDSATESATATATTVGAPAVIAAQLSPVSDYRVADISSSADSAGSSVAVPADSGVGKRVIFSIADGRVWLVNSDGSMARTYRASGSIHDNLLPGSYRVQLKTRHTTSYDYASTMQYFVRFTSGRNAPIGFHDIPVDNGGHLVQTTGDLGKPLSSGCIRQARSDAIELWDFTSTGIPVEVVP